MTVYQVKLYSVFRLKYKDYNNEKGIEITCEQELTMQELLKVLDIDAHKVAFLTVNGNLYIGKNPLIQSGDTIGVFPPLPSGG